MSRFNSLLLIVLFVFLLVDLTFGQAATPQGTPQTFSNSVMYEPRQFPNEKYKAKDYGRVTGTAVKQGPMTIPVSVFDDAAKFVSGLQRSNFQVFIEGRKADVSSVETRTEPLHVFLLVDTSVSTYYSIDIMRDMATAIVEHLGENDEVSVLRFAEDLSVLTEMTRDREKIRQAIKKIKFGTQGTALYETISSIFKKHIPPVSGRTVLVVLTDGVDTFSRTSYSSSLELPEKGNTAIYPIFFDTSQLMKRDPGSTVSRWVRGGIAGSIASETLEKAQADNKRIEAEQERGRLYLSDLTFLSGGRAISSRLFYESPKETAGQLIDEIKRQYFITFSATETAVPGERKRLMVIVNKPNLTVLARGSYIARPQ